MSGAFGVAVVLRRLLMGVMLLLPALGVQAQWRQLGAFGSTVTAVHVLDKHGEPRTIFVGLNNGDMHVSRDGGVSWSPCSAPGLKGRISDFSFKNATTGWVSVRAFGTTPGVFRTVDGGISWQGCPVTGEITSVAYSARSNSVFTTSLGAKSLASIDDGNSFGVWGPGSLTGLSFTPDGFGTASCYTGQLLYTHDGGFAWSFSNNRDECWSTLNIPGSSTVFTVSEVTQNVSRSLDAGVRFDPITRLDWFGKPTGDIRGNCTQIYIQTSSRVLASSDEGATWRDLKGPGNEADTRFYVAGTAVYAGDLQGRLFFFSDPDQLIGGRIGTRGASEQLVAQGCLPIDTALYLLPFISCSSTTITEIEQLPARNGQPSPFTLLKQPKLPLLLDREDTIGLRYTPTGGLDTLRIRVRFVVSGAEFDTILQISGLRETSTDLAISPEWAQLVSQAPCRSVDAEIKLTNGACDTLMLLDVSFADAEHFSYLSPQLPLHFERLQSSAIRIRAFGELAGSFNTIATLTFRGPTSTFKRELTISLEVAPGNPQISVVPGRLKIPPANLCGEKYGITEIVNGNCIPLRVDSIVWTQAHPAIEFMSDGLPQMRTTPFTIPPLATDTLLLRFKPLKSGGATAYYRIYFTSDSLHVDTPCTVSSSTFTKSTVQVTDQSLAFGEFKICEERSASTWVYNNSCEASTLNYVVLPTTAGMTVEGATLGLRLERGDSVLITVRLAPKSAGYVVDKLSMFFRTDLNSEQAIDIDLQAKILPAVHSLDLSQTSIRFDSLAQCGSADTSITLENRGTCDTLVLRDFTLLGLSKENWFSVTAGRAFPIALAPGERITFSIQTRATSSPSSEGSITLAGVWSNGSLFDSTIALAATTVRGLDPLVVIAYDSLLSTGICSTVGGSMILANRKCEQIVIDEIMLGGTNQNGAFSLRNVTYPIVLEPGEIVRVEYVFDPDRSPSADVELRIAPREGMNGVSVTVLGRSFDTRGSFTLGSRINANAFVRCTAGDDVTVEVIATSTIPPKSGVRKVAFPLLHDGDMLTLAPESWAASVDRVRLDRDADGSQVTFELTSDASFAPGDVLLTLHGATAIARDSTSTIAIGAVTLNDGDTVFARCGFTATADSLARLELASICSDEMLRSWLRDGVVLTNVVVRPNPYNHKQRGDRGIEVVLHSSASATVRFQTVDALGRLVAEDTRVIEAGMSTQSLALPRSTGSYNILIEARDGGVLLQRVARKLVIE